MCTYMPPPGKKATSAKRSKLLSSEAVALFMLWFIIGDWVAVGNTVRESGQQGQSTAAPAWLYLPRSAPQDECDLCLCSYEGIFNVKQKATVFITNEWTRWESQWKGWHLCLFIQQQQQQNGLFSPRKARHDHQGRQKISIGWLFQNDVEDTQRNAQNLNTPTSMNYCLVRVKNKMQLISSLYKTSFFFFELLHGFCLIQNATLCHFHVSSHIGTEHTEYVFI